MTSAPIRPSEPGTSVLRNPGVVGIGLGSLLSDAGHEMATAALPGFLRSISAPAAALGIIEGFAEGALSVSKLAGGVLADQPGVERRSVAAGGYALTALGHGAFGLATVWPVVAVARSLSWVARGGKAPARDALLSGSVPREQLGRAFGVERTMDSTGAVLGPLLAAPLIVAVGYRGLFALSIIPGLLAAVAVLAVVREVPRTGAVRSALPSLRAVLGSSVDFKRLVLGIGIFGLGNFSATLLILRATDLFTSGGRSLTDASAVAVLLYAVHNSAASFAAYPAGAACDRVGRRPVLVSGILLFAGSCLLFALGSAGVLALAVLFGLVGASRGIVETAQGAYVAQLVEDEGRGRAFGLVGLVEGGGDLVSNVTVGVLWTVTAPAAGFVFAATTAVLGAGVVLTAGRHGTGHTPRGHEGLDHGADSKV